MLKELEKGASNVIAITELLQNNYERDETSDGTLSDDHEDDFERTLEVEDLDTDFIP